MKYSLLVGVLVVLAGPWSAARADTGLHPAAGPAQEGAPAENPAGAPERPTWKYKAAARRRNPMHEPTGVGAFLVPAKAVTLAIELGWPFYELRFGVGLHHRVTLELGLRGMYAWTVGGYGGIKVGLLQNGGRSTALSVRLIGGYQHLVEDQETQFRSLGGGNGVYGELSLLGAVRWGSGTLMINGGARLSAVDECLDSDRDWQDLCPVNPFGTNDSGVMLTGFMEAGYIKRLHPKASFFIAFGVDVFVLGQPDFPAMLRLRMGLQLGL